MSRGFGASIGAGTTDRVTSALTAHATQRTYVVFALRNGNLGLGRLFDKALGSATPPEICFHNNFNSSYNYQRQFSTTTGEWRIARPATGTFFHFAITYDASSVANDPLFYLNGVAQSVTEVTAPVGTLVSTADPYQIGNRQLGTAVWDGQLFRFLVYNRILGQAELEAQAAGGTPSTTALAEHIEMGFSQSPIVSAVLANPTVVGTVATADPVFVPPVSYGPTNGPLTVHATNGRYLADASGAPVFLVGPNTYSINMDFGSTDPPPVVDWAAYLAGFTAEGHNFLKFWQRENSKGEVVGTGGTYWEPPIWVRSGPGNAADGKLKYDLDQVNPDYLTRLRDRALDCQAAGIYVSVLFFQGWSVDSKGTGEQTPWLTHPFRSVNNINGIDGDPNANNEGTEVLEGTIPGIVAIHDAYIAEVVGALGDLDNIIWEPWNEPTGTTASWAYFEHIIAEIRAAETANSFAAKPILASRTWLDTLTNSNAQLFALPGAEIVAPGTWVGNLAEAYGPQYDDTTPETDPPVALGDRVVSFDSDHNHNNPSLTPPQSVWDDGTVARVMFWKNALRGAGILSMLTSITTPTVLSPMTNTRVVLKAIRETMQGLTNLAAMTPQNALASTGYCLANASLTGEYLAYLPSGGAVTMNLTASPGVLGVTWINAATGAPTEATSVQGGGAATVLTSPFGAADAVLHLTTVPVTVVTFQDTGLNPGTPYTYRVQVEDTATPTNTSAFSAPLLVTTLGTGEIDTEPPSQPGTPVFVSRTTTSLTVDWPESTDNAAVEDYVVTAGTESVIVAAPPATIPGLEPFTDYLVSVVARDTATPANESQPSASATFTTLRLARAFTGGQVVRATVLPAITDYPLTLGISVYPTLNDTGFIVSLANHLSNTDFLAIKAQLVSGTIRAHATRANSTGFANGASSTLPLALNTWQRIIAVFASATSCTVRMVGDVAVLDATDKAFPAGLSRLTVGGIDRLTPVQPYVGRAADLAIWSAALDDVEQTAWLAGTAAWFLRPASLVTHSLLHGESPEPDLIGSSDLTVVGAATADGPEDEAFLTDPEPEPIGEPGVVTGLVVTAVGANSISFSWNAADNAVLYRIRRLDQAVINEKAEGDRTFTAEGLLPFTAYTFTVAAVNAAQQPVEGPLTAFTQQTRPVHSTAASGRQARSVITPRN